jgi:bacterioferritin-associated ferredoxin
MYVCMCNGYTDKDIRAVVRRGGVHTATDAYAALGAGFCCGTCKDCAEGVVNEELPNVTLLAAE